MYSIEGFLFYRAMRTQSDVNKMYERYPGIC